MINNKKIAFYGCGQLAEMALKLWPDKIPTPSLFVDQNKKGQFKKKKIINFENFKKKKKNYILILSVFKIKPKIVNKIFKSINQNILTVYDIFDKHIQSSFGNGWNSVLNKNKNKKLQLINNLFKDSNSKKILKSVINWRYKRILDNNYPLKKEKGKYISFLKNQKKKNSQFNIIDFGQYNYSFLEDCLSCGISIKSYMGIEASNKRFRLIKKMTNFYKNKIKNITLFCAAVSDKEGKVNFLDNGLLSARILRSTKKSTLLMKSNTKSTKSHTLNFFYNKVKEKNYPTIIKLHIEGYEDRVIKQSSTLLKKEEKIILIINLSHNQNSLISLPILLKNIGYKNFKLYNHSLFGEGLTLYATK
jgi:FkbM family methyltransferase